MPAKKPDKRANNGGSRDGSGRKAVDGVKTKQQCVSLDDESIKTALQLGKGDKSYGIRRALRMVKALIAQRIKID